MRNKLVSSLISRSLYEQEMLEGLCTRLMAVLSGGEGKHLHYAEEVEKMF